MIKKTQQRFGSLDKTNVMSPLNWFATAFEAVLIPTVAWQHNNWSGIACAILAVIMFIFYIYVYRHFMLKDPDRLQSEKYKLAQQELLLSSGSLQIPDKESAATLKEIISENKMP